MQIHSLLRFLRSLKKYIIKRHIRTFVQDPLFSFFILCQFVIFCECSHENSHYISARVTRTQRGIVDSLRAMDGIQIIAEYNRFIDIRLPESRFFELGKMGYDMALLIELEQVQQIPSCYRRTEQVHARIDSLAHQNSSIVRQHKIGSGSFLGAPIYALKISDNPELEEDEPSVLFYGGMHAQEPLGVEVCLYLAKYLCEQYPQNPAVKKWINEEEIWIVPLCNPEGYDKVISGEIEYPWWRKNLRDNNNDGLFDISCDGVDLNRNFGFNWDLRADHDPTSWYYSGKSAFSESETRAIETLAIEQRFVSGISFHSHGQLVFYPWSDFPEPPDKTLLREIADEMAKAVKKRGRTYDVFPLNGRSSQSSVWLYGALGSLDFIVEVGDEFFPSHQDMKQEVEAAAETAFYLLERTLGPGVKGVVSSASNGKSLSARVTILEADNSNVWPRYSDKISGRYYRLLAPGEYILIISKPDYASVQKSIFIKKNGMTEYNVSLLPEK